MRYVQISATILYIGLMAVAGTAINSAKDITGIQ
jgi:hypothetical protein